MNNSKFEINDFKSNYNYSISASAGTGKTHNIVDIVKKLVTNLNIPIDKLLIVTYTEKAAGELKVRIKNEIPNIDINSAHIGTIHSFCKETIDEFNMIMNLPSKMSVINEDKNQELYDKFIRDKLYNESLMIEDVKDSKYNYIKEIIKSLYLDSDGALDPSVVNIKDMTPFDSFYTILMNKVSSLKGYSDDFIANYFRTCASNLNANLNQEVKNYFISLQNEFLTIDSDEVKDGAKKYLESNKKDINFKEQYKMNTTRNSIVKNTKNGSFNSSKFYFKDMDKEEFPILNEIKYCNGVDELSRYIESAIEIYNCWLEEKRHNKWITFNDMLRLVREEVLHNNDLVEALRNKYTYALIDEFQDTNQLQWDIFKNVFLNSNRNNITVVGDRKQSIYSFQGADLTVYDKAVNEIVSNGGIECVLPNNYRSSKSMIEGYNKLFEMESFKSLNYSRVGVGKPKLKLEYKGKEIKGIGIILNKDNDEITNVSNYEYAKKSVEMIVDFCTKDDGKNTRLIVYEEKKDDLGNIIEKSRNVTFKDFLVLVRAKSEYIYFEKQLKRVGIPYIKYKDQTLFTGKECNEWITLFDAILKSDFTGNNRKAFRKVLLTKFFGKSIEDISSPDFDRDDNEEMELILKWKELAKDYKYNELIESIINDSNIEERLGSLTEIQSLNTFKQIGDYSLNYLLEGNFLYNLRNNLYNLANGSSLDDDTEGAVIAKGTDFDCVELMTMHASKGLDGTIVFTPGGFKKLGNKKSCGIYHDKEDGKAYLSFDNNNLKEEKLNEFDRLFYVAYTRGTHLLVLPYYKDNKDVRATMAINEFINNSANDNLYDRYYLQDNSKSEKELKEDVIKIIDSIDDSKNLDSRLKSLKEFSKTIKKHNMYKHSYSSMSEVKTSDKIINDNLHANKEGEESTEILTGFDLSCKPVNISYSDCLPLEIPTGFPKGAKAGTTLHEVFELFKFESIDSDNNLNDLILERYKVNGLKCNDKSLDYVNKMVNNVLHAKLPVIKGSNACDEMISLKDITQDNRKAEIEFNFNVIGDINEASNYCTGFVDLMFKNGDYYSILDWKSDTINDFDLLSYNKLEDLKKRVDGHYSIQRVLYSYCLVKWLNGLGLGNTLEDTFNNHFGGIYYCFIRGCNSGTSNGIYAQTWESWNDLENEFNKIMEKCKYKLKGEINDAK